MNKTTTKVQAHCECKPAEASLCLAAYDDSSEIINDYFYETILCSEKALYAGLQLQEDLLKLSAQLLSSAPFPIRKELQTFSKAVFPRARTRLDQVLEAGSLRIMLLNRASSQIVGFLSRMAGVLQSDSYPDALIKSEDLAMRFLKTVEADSHIFVNTNSKILEICKELISLKPALPSSSQSRLAEFEQSDEIPNSPRYSLSS